VKRHLHAEYGFADPDRAHVSPGGDDDSGEIAARCHGSIPARTFADGNAAVECPLGNVDVIDIDGGCEYFYQHLPGTKYRCSDFRHLKNFGECTGSRPSR
jgi:hypothetical protein